MKFCLPFYRRMFNYGQFAAIWLLVALVTIAKANDGSFPNTPISGSTSSGSSSTLATPISLTVSPESPAVCAGGSISLSLAGCPATGAILWSTGQTTASITVKPAQTTTYTARCSVTGPKGVTAVDVNRTVSVNDPITITGSPVSQSACGGATISFSVSSTGSDISYSWTQNGVIVPGATGSQLTLTNAQLSQAGTYIAKLTNTCGTVSSAPAQLSLSPGITVGNTPTPATCSGTSTGQIFVSATGGTGQLQFQLEGQAFQTSNIFSNLKAGTYKVTVKDHIGCTAQTIADVKQPTSLSLTMKAVNAKCAGGADGGIIVSGSGGNAPYQYQLNAGPLQTGETFLDLKDKTTYVVTLVDATGCSTSQTAVIGAPQPLDIIATVTPTKCTGSGDGIISVSGAGGAGAYQFQIGSAPFQAGTVFTGLAANTYQIGIKDGNGCLGTKAVVVTQPALLSLTAAVTPVNCFGDNSGAITLTPGGGTGPLQYQLTSTKIPQTSNVFKNLAMGNYTVVGTDANGCTALVSVTIGKADPLKIQASVVPATCCVCPTGQVALTTGGGAGSGRQFQLNSRPPQTSNQFTALQPGTYLFRVIDEVGCRDSVRATVTDASAMTLLPGQVKDVACSGGKDGEASVKLVGGVKPFTFYWQTEGRDTLAARTQTQTGLAEGTYTVSVLDSNRCTTTTTFVTVKALAPLPPKPIITQTSTTLSVVDVNGVQWYIKTDSSTGKAIANATQSTITPSQSGSYYVIVTQNGCASPPSDFVTFIVTAITEPLGTLSIKVAPNPIADRLRLDIEQTDRHPVQIQLFNAAGSSVHTFQIPAFSGKKQAEWPLTGISPGIYLLKAEAGDRQSVIRVLVE
ncbi:T9SS type A sorting domain-containing protein [Spirosoma sp. SC4-14]|uniref:T9SS type A sorting domain-containing protein n=1 Tax=Spirosoma sp. SC4-14 TaxID=3128900 RepID=UPI0030D4087D